MAAAYSHPASTFFTVRIKNLAGRIIEIPDVIKHDTVSMLKWALAYDLNTPRPNVDRIVLIHMDTSTGINTILQDDEALENYPIDYVNEILYVFVNPAGGRRKRIRRTKRRLLKKRRTRRTHRKHY